MDGYKAFLSYSHAADGALAPRLQSSLHQFAKPWHQLRAIRIFRDRTSLSASPGLWSSIERALRSSEFFLLMASPAAAQSPWVRRELETFLSLSSSQKVLVVLTDGNLAWDSAAGDFDWALTTAMPRLQKPVFESEPLWVDLRSLRRADDVSLRNPEFRDGVARLSSEMRGIPTDKLIGEDVRQHQRTLRVVRSARVAFALLIVALFAAGYYSFRKQSEALSSQSQALTSAAEALAAAARTRAEMIVSWAASLEIKDPLSSALVLSHLDPRQPPDRAVALARALANELPLALLDGIDPIVSQDGDRLLTFGNDGHARLTRVDNLRYTTLLARGRTVVDGALNATGKRAALAYDDGVVTVWSNEGHPKIVSERPGYSPKYSVMKRGSSVALSDDGSLVAFIAGNAAFLARSDGRGKLIALRGHTDAVLSVTLSADARLVATTSLDRSTRVWRTGDGAALATHRIVRSYPMAAEFSRDGKRLLTNVDNGSLHLWNTLTKGAALELDPLNHTPYHAKLSPSGNEVIGPTKEGPILLWKLSRPRRPQMFRGHADWVNVALMTADGLVVSASDDETARTWGSGSGGEMIFKTGKVSAMAVSTKHGRMFISGLDGTTKVWSLRGGAGEEKILSVPGTKLQSVSFSHDGRRLVTGATDHTIRLWDVASGAPHRVLTGHRGGVSSAVFSANDQEILSMSEDGSARIWDANTGRMLRTLTCPTGRMSEVDFSGDGTLVVASCGNAFVWRHKDGGPPVELQDPTRTSRHARFSPDGSQVLVSSLHSARLWNVDGSGSTIVYRGEEGRVIGTAKFSPDGDRIIVNSGNVAKLWRRGDETQPVRINSPFGVADAQLSPDGLLVLIQTWASESYLGPLNGRGTALTLEDTWSVVQPRFSRDGHHVVTAADSNHARDARVWNTRKAGPPLVLSGHSSWLKGIDISPDGNLVATVSDDGTARLWSLQWRDLRAFVERRVRELGACLSANERTQFLGETAEEAGRAAEACSSRRATERGPRSTSSKPDRGPVRLPPGVSALRPS
jgi:WD40 repeat protein